MSVKNQSAAHGDAGRLQLGRVIENVESTRETVARRAAGVQLSMTTSRTSSLHPVGRSRTNPRVELDISYRRSRGNADPVRPIIVTDFVFAGSRERERERGTRTMVRVWDYDYQNDRFGHGAERIFRMVAQKKISAVSFSGRARSSSI
jgi:hypothetical protein